MLRLQHSQRNRNQIAAGMNVSLKQIIAELAIEDDSVS